MADEKNFPIGLSLETKDWLLLIPTIGSTLAIVYELGSFLALGTAAFALFSITDHLLWALQVVPYAMIVVGLSAIFALCINIIRRERQARSNPETSSTVVRVLLFVGKLAIDFAFLLYGYASGAVTLMVIGIASILVTFIPRRFNTAPIKTLFATLCVIAFVLALGFDRMSGFLDRATPARFDFGDGNFKDLVLARSGDRALLLYDQQRREFLFTKFDELKSIVWLRSPQR